MQKTPPNGYYTAEHCNRSRDTAVTQSQRNGPQSLEWEANYLIMQTNTESCGNVGTGTNLAWRRKAFLDI